MTETIRHTADIAADPAAAFARFTGELGSWWPRAYTWSGDVLVAIGIEPGIGGLCYERGPHGFRCDWGRVLAWEPPRRLVIAWQISPRREPVPDPARASVVEVRFEPESTGGTRVTVEHRAFDRHGAGADEYRQAMASPEGWQYILRRFAALRQNLNRDR